LAGKPSVFYRLADGATAAMADSSGHGATGSYFAPDVTLGQPAPLANDPATSTAVNGNTAAHSFPTDLPLNNSARTIEAWVDTTWGGTGYLAGYGSQNTTQGFALAVNPSQVYLSGYNDDLSFSSPTTINDGSWHFVALSTNGTTATAYVDGTALGTQSFNTPLDTLASSSGFVVGSAPWGGPFLGDEADVAVFPTALTATQIQAQYQASENGASAGGVAPLSSAHSRGGRS
jgi:hypothetical protein